MKHLPGKTNETFLYVVQIEYNFKWLQAPLVLKKVKDKTLRPQPLAALNVSFFFSPQK